MGRTTQGGKLSIVDSLSYKKPKQWIQCNERMNEQRASTATFGY